MWQIIIFEWMNIYYIIYIYRYIIINNNNKIIIIMRCKFFLIYKFDYVIQSKIGLLHGGLVLKTIKNYVQL